MSETNPNLPTALRASVERANALMAEVASPAPAGGQEGAAPAVPAAPPQPAAVDPPAVPATQAVAPIAPPAPPAGDDTAEQRFRSEQGRRQAAERAAEAARAESANLRLVLAARATAAPAEAPTAPVVSPADRITDAERAEWGPDMIAVVTKAARAVFAEMVAPLQHQIAALQNGVQQVGNVVKEDAGKTFLRDLTTLTNSMWRELNTSDEFLDWLDENDPFAGVPRRALLNDAQNALNATRAANFFNSFLSQREALGTAPAAPGTPGVAAAIAAATPSLTLAELAAPGKAKGGAPLSGADKPIWTSREIAAFYADVRKGVFAGREAEKNRLEADIIAAAGENRIRN